MTVSANVSTDVTSAKQLALGAGTFIGDTLGAALKGWQTYSTISLQNKLANAQIDQAFARNTAPKMGVANRTPYAGQGAYYALPPGTIERPASSWATTLGAVIGGVQTVAAPLHWYQNYKSWLMMGAAAVFVYLVVR